MRGWLLVPALVAAAGFYAFLDGDAGIRRWVHLRAELAEARGRIATHAHEVDVLRAEVAALEADEFAIERAIREDLQLAKPGETLLRTPADEASNARFP